MRKFEYLKNLDDVELCEKLDKQRRILNGFVFLIILLVLGGTVVMNILLWNGGSWAGFYTYISFWILLVFALIIYLSYFNRLNRKAIKREIEERGLEIE